MKKGGPERNSTLHIFYAWKIVLSSVDSNIDWAISSHVTPPFWNKHVKFNCLDIVQKNQAYFQNTKP